MLKKEPKADRAGLSPDISVIFVASVCQRSFLILQACYGVLTNTEVREVLDRRQLHGACAVIFVVDWKEVQLYRQVC